MYSYVFICVCMNRNSYNRMIIYGGKIYECLAINFFNFNIH